MKCGEIKWALQTGLLSGALIGNVCVICFYLYLVFRGITPAVHSVAFAQLNRTVDININWSIILIYAQFVKNPLKW